MTTSITIGPHQLGAALRKEGEKMPKIIAQSALAAANRLKTYMVRLTDRMGITDTGIYKNSFVVHGSMSGTGRQATVINEAPHAGIVEMGARPHHVGKEGREALKLWCMRKLGLREKEAEEASWAIAHKIAEVGIQGRYVFRNSLDVAIKFYKEELVRRLKNQ